LNQLEIAFIGAGNMASSIIGGLLEQGLPAASIRASDPSQESLQRLQQLAPICIATSNTDAVRGADVVILAVKPQVMKAVLADIQEVVIEQGALVISIAAGITIASMENGLSSASAIVRCMPNTPALLGSGATALFANANASVEQCTAAESILDAVGEACWVPQEHLLDAVTALSGSGPAYFFLFMEAMASTGEELGLDPQTSRALAIQTALGASQMAAAGEVDLEELRRRVTSPGGTTQAAIESFEDNGLRATIATAMTAAYDRAREMAREMG
jgi:pyrroline-5-carboxylate reductase